MLARWMTSLWGYGKEPRTTGTGRTDQNARTVENKKEINDGNEADMTSLNAVAICCGGAVQTEKVRRCAG